MARIVVWLLCGLAIAGAAVFLLTGPGGDADDYGYDDVTDAGSEAESGPALRGSGDGKARADAGTTSGRFRIQGRVLDDDGKPVADVPIEVRRTGAAWNQADPNSYYQPLEKRIRESVARLSKPGRERGPLAGRARSGSDGAFVVGLDESGKYELQALPGAPRFGTTGSAHVHEEQREQETDLYVSAGSALRGRVLDASDRPVAAAVAAGWWSNQGSQSRTWRHAPVDTDPTDGTFRFAVVPDGKITLSLTLAGRRRITGISVKTPYEGEFVVRIDTSGGAIAGRLSDAQGAAIPGGVVVVRVDRAKDEAQAGGSTTLTTKTDAEGRYRIEDAPTGPVRLVQAAAEGFLALQQHSAQAPPWAGAVVRAGKTLQLDLTLNRGGGVFGVVTQQGGNTPLDGAKVTLYPAQRAGGVPASAIRSQETDAKGHYRFDAVDLGRYVAICEKDGWYLPLLEPGAGNAVNFAADRRTSPPELTVVMTAEGNEFERNLEMARGLPVKGRVVDADGNGVAGADILARGYGLTQLAWNWGIQARQQEPLAKSTAGGAFEIPGLPAQEAWVLYARKKGYAGAFGEAFPLTAEGGTPSVRLQLLPGAVLRGLVQGLDAAELTSAQVAFYGSASELAADRSFQKVKPDGTFELTGIPPGTWTLYLWMNGRQGTQKQVTNVQAGEVREGIELEMATGVEVSGTLVDEDGKAVPHQSLMLQAVGGGSWLNGQTDESGAFRFRGAKAGPTQVMIWGGSGSSRRIGETFDAPATGLRITYKRDPTVTIFGKILGPDDRPIPLATVQIRSATDGSGNRNLGMSGSDGMDALNGTFRKSLSGKPPYKVVVRSPRDADGKPLNLMETSKTVTDPDVEVVIRLHRGEELSGVVVDAKGQGITGAPVRVGERAVRTNENGAFRIAGLGPGSTYLYVGPVPGYASPPYRQVQAGTTGLRIELKAGFKIKGKVFDADGNPVTQGHVNATWKAPEKGQPGHASTQVQPDGTFTVDGIPGGVLVTLSVQVWNSGGGAAFAPTQVDGVRPGAEDIVVRLGAGLSIEGFVLKPDGKPATGCWVNAAPADASGLQTGWTQIDEHGAWKISGLKPIEYDVRVMRQDGGAAPTATRVEAPVSGVRITLPTSARLSGRVVGLDASEASTWRVHIRDEQGRNVKTATPDAEGKWSFASINADVRYYVGVSKRGEDRYAKTGPVEAGRTDLVLRMEQGRTISGTLDRSLAPEGNVWVLATAPGWQARARFEGESGFVIRGLPPGAYDLTARSADGATSRAEGVQAGAADVRMRLEPAK